MKRWMNEMNEMNGMEWWNVMGNGEFIIMYECLLNDNNNIYNI